MAAPAPKAAGIALAFVGAVVPDEPAYHTEAFNRAGNMFQIQLLRGMARGGFQDVDVFSARPVPSFPKVSKIVFPSGRARLDDGIVVRLLPFLNVTPLKQMILGLDVLVSLFAWGLRKHAQKRVVLSYNLSVPPAAFTLLGARLARAKAVVSVNDVNVPGQTVPTAWLFSVDFALQRWLMPRFDGHIVVADQIADDFFPGKPYVRVEGGVDSDFLERTRRGGERVDVAGDLVLAFAGTLNEVNGVLLILEALRLVPDRNVRLTIAGTGPLESVVRESARQDPRIEFRGSLDSAGVAEMYEHADILLNIRLTTTVNTRYFFPSKLIEYLGSGVPTITTRVAHSDHEFASLAYFLSDESPQGLAKLLGVVRSQSPGERHRMGQRARTYISTHKTWEAQTGKVAQYLQAVVEG
jgi:glycosyltransferase involved in cell wall biosynthesis